MIKKMLPQMDDEIFNKIVEEVHADMIEARRNAIGATDEEI